MNEKTILEKTEIEDLKKLTSELNSVTLDLGEIEIQFEELKNLKKTTLEKLRDIQIQQNNLGKKLSQKYGSGTIDLLSGEIAKKI